MFDGVPVPVAEQLFHQFIAPTTTTTTTTTTPLPLHHQLSSSTTSFPILHNYPFPLFDPYNNTSNHPSQHLHHHQLPDVLHHQHNLLFHPLHHKDDAEQEQHEDQERGATFNFETDHRRQQLPDDDESMDSSSWTNDEVLALLRIRSSMESWFPQLTWDHVSRKLAELGFKKSAEKCKEKFEDESRYFNTNINNCSKNNNNFRFLSELEELYQGSSDHHHQNNNQSIDNHDVIVATEKAQHQLEDMMDHHALEEDSSIKQTQEESCGKNIIMDEEKSTIRAKRKRKRRSSIKFEMFKGFCESIVNKMMAQQEEVHNKLLEDMMKRDQEKFAREEAWKKQEMEKMNKELEIMAQEQAIAGDRQATIIQFLKNCAANNNSQNSDKRKIAKDPSQIGSTSNNHSSPPPPLLHSQNPNPTSTGESNLLEPITTTSNLILDHNQIQTNCSSSPTQTNSGLPITIPGENPSSSTTLQVLPSPSRSSTPPNNRKQGDNSNSEVSTFKPSSSNTTMAATITDHHQKDDVGRRWPRDEVLALINLRCTILKNNNNELDKAEEAGNNNNNSSSSSKVVPLWERMSQGMAELGYKRSAKRCKEKWENINKYFRKTKDVNKKRSIDSRTCPYFQQLSHLYSQGKPFDASSQKEKHESQFFNNQPQLSESSSQVGSGEFSTLHHDNEGEETTLIHTTTSPLNFD